MSDSLRSRKGALTKRMDVLFPQESPDKCSVCNEPVVDGRYNYCSQRCREIANAVQRMFVWDEVREQVLERDAYTCQSCGVSRADAKDPPTFEVDHITPLADDGHPFDESNLQTLCRPCHREKTAEQNRDADVEEQPAVTLDDYLES